MFELLVKAGGHYYIFDILIVIHTEREAINMQFKHLWWFDYYWCWWM